MDTSDRPDRINTPEYLEGLKETIRDAEGTWYYDGIYHAHTDISRFFGWLDYVERFERIKGAKALDIGCGSGGMVIALSQRGALEVAGLEVDKSLFDLCRLRLERYPHAHVYLSDGTALPFEDDSFDIVTSIHVIEHVSDTEAFMLEVFRVLKKGGVCLVECPNRAFPVEPHNRIALIPYLPKVLADLLCVILLSEIPFLRPDMRLRLKNVGSFSHFISTGELTGMIRRCGGRILLRNPEERLLGDPDLPRSLIAYLQRKPNLLKKISQWFSRNAMVIFRK